MDILKNKKFLLISGIVLGVIALVVATLIVLNSFGISLFGSKQDTPPEEEVSVAYLARGTLSDGLEVTVVDQDGKVWIKSADIEKVYVSYEKEKGRYLELALNENGAEKLNEAADGKKTLTLKVNDIEFASPIVKDDITESSAIFVGEYVDIMKCFNVIAIQEFDETEDLSQANNLNIQ